MVINNEAFFIGQRATRNAQVIHLTLVELVLWYIHLKAIGIIGICAKRLYIIGNEMVITVH